MENSDSGQTVPNPQPAPEPNPSPVPQSSPEPSHEPAQEPKHKTRHFSAIMMVSLLLVGLLVGGFVGYALSYSDFNSKLNNLQSQLQGVSSNTSGSYFNATYLVDQNVSLSLLYPQVQPSVVVIQDLASEQFGPFISYAEQQGSGFIVSVSIANNQQEQVIVTNDHVVYDATNITVTLADGSSYEGTVLGSDFASDIAVLTITPMPSNLPSLTLVDSDSLQVGQPVVAVGSPYGLSGTLTTGVISALGRTITESSETESNPPTISDIIQTSTAINPGNSGGPLVNYLGQVVGITTAAVSSSQGLGFAIPSNTIIRELSALVTTGSYNEHPTIDATLTDMSLPIAQAMGTSVTYGSLVETVSAQNGLLGGSTQANIWGTPVTIGGDIIIAVSGVRVTNTDDLLSYLVDHTLPGQVVNFTVVRNGQTQVVQVTIGNQS